MNEREEQKKSIQEEYIDIARNSLIRMQYSCSGNSNYIGDDTMPKESEEDTTVEG